MFPSACAGEKWAGLCETGLPIEAPDGQSELQRNAARCRSAENAIYVHCQLLQGETDFFDPAAPVEITDEKITVNRAQGDRFDKSIILFK